mgnify:CR=1 FL=1|jgi:organic radical activating enzyme
MTTHFKPNNESYIEYKKRVLDSKSSSFCGAKWYYATIWLNTGQTTACHHPLPHQVDAEAVMKNPALLSNTPTKKTERQQMLKGERPSGCSYCWKIEDISKDNVSDRVHKSVAYTEKDLQEAFDGGNEKDFPVKYLELSFDRTCNFACSYCNPAFSTTWAKDIKKNGPYTEIGEDGKRHYGHPHNQASRFQEDDNPYIKAFFEWWDKELHSTVHTLRLTGGEPLMHRHVWKMMDFLKSRPNVVEYFAVNSNLVTKPALFDKFLKEAKGINGFHLYTSNESCELGSEYIRDGMVWTQWKDNLARAIDSKCFDGVNVMCTVSAIALEGLAEFLRFCVEMKKTNDKKMPQFSLNILRFPNFQSPLVLPLELRKKFACEIETFTTKNEKYLNEMEVSNCKRLITYLKQEDDTHMELRKQFKNYFKQYDKRRDKDFEKTFPIIGEWYRGI